MKKRIIKAPWLPKVLTFLVISLYYAGSAQGMSAPFRISDTSAAPNRDAVAATRAADSQLIAQPPNQSNGFFADASCGTCGGQQSVAENFILAEPREIAQARIWGGYHPGNTPLATDDFDVYIYQDNAGFPGTEVYSASGLAAGQRTTTGTILFGVDEYEYVIDLPTPPTLPAGSYWVEIFNDTSLGTDDWFWETGNRDAFYGLPDATIDFSTPGVNWIIEADLELAIELISPANLSITKSALPTTFVFPGDVITYTIVVVNTGTEDLTDVTVNDPLLGLGSLSCDGGTNVIPSLPVSATANCEASYSIDQGDMDAGFVTNQASATRLDSLLQPRVVISNEVTVNRLDECFNGPLTIPDGAVFSGAGSTVYWSTVSIDTEVPAVDGVIVEAPHVLELHAPVVELNPLFNVESDVVPPGGAQLKIVTGPVTCP